MTLPLTATAVAYEARFGWTRKGVLSLLTYSVGAGLVWLTGMPLVFEAVLALLFLLTAVRLLAPLVELRVDPRFPL